VVGGAPQWALHLEPLAKASVSAMMPLKKGDVTVANPRRPCEGFGVGRCSSVGARFGAPGQDTSKGCDAPEEGVPMVANPWRPGERCGGGRCSTVGARFGAPDQGFSIGYDAPEERGC
jgi:hypothetical protein